MKKKTALIQFGFIYFQIFFILCLWNESLMIFESNVNFDNFILTIHNSKTFFKVEPENYLVSSLLLPW